ncbi:MAG: hypothetical protein ABJA98_06525 [Acidobacteriota bacterium]
MALPTVNLDDRTFEQLFGLLRKQIDVEEWVDHNLSDPGIALLDLLCWIGEMILYRADRVPDAHIEKFADLIMDPPEPVTVLLTLTAPTPAAAVTVPAGTRFATDFSAATAVRPAHRFVFETIAPVTFRGVSPQTAPTQTLSVTARELMVIELEALGVSNGLPNQRFPLRPVHTSLGIPLDRPTPVLIDFVRRSATYDPNPLIKVGTGVPSWELKRFLMTEESFIDPAGPAPKPQKFHYIVDPDGAIRFGDDTFGSIPPAGAAIVCTRYRVLQGPDALIAANALVHQLDPVAGLALTGIQNGEAEGADFFFTPEERIREGLKRFRRPARLITAADFEEVLMVDFNELQQRAKAPELLRAIALLNRKPGFPDRPAPGHVTVVVLAASRLNLDDELTDPGPFNPPRTPQQDFDQKQALVVPSASLADKLQRFLDKRRLITTQLHVAAPSLGAPTLLPKLVAVTIAATVVIQLDRNSSEMTETIRREIRRFLGVVGGGFDGRGWPLGESVYRSKLFRLIENIDGVDHVDTLTLSPAGANGDVALGPLSLPAIAMNGLSVAVVRA